MNSLLKRSLVWLSTGLIALSSIAWAQHGEGETRPLSPPDPLCRPLVKTVLWSQKADPLASKRLAQLFKADQADRMGAQLPINLEERDTQRQAEVLNLLQKGRLSSGQDYFNAALIFQHSWCAHKVWLAHMLAERALQGGYNDARWLYAATYDRWLRIQNKPQKYGTQYTSDHQGCHTTLDPYDPKTTDAERAKYHVPPLAKALAKAEEFDGPDCRKK